MNAVVQYIDLGRGPGYNRVCIKVGNYILAVTDSSDFLDDDKKAQKVADRINKKLKKDRDAIIEWSIKEEKKRAKAKRVLLIEDDKYLAADLKYYIEDAGHDFTVCSDTDEILQIYPEIDTYDIIILGLMMLKGESFLTSEKEEEKELDVGEILYNRIRKDFPKQDILIITAKSIEDIKIDFGGIHVIQKPLLTEGKIKAILKYIG